MEAGKRYWALIEPVWKTFPLQASPEVVLAHCQTLSPPVRLLLAAHWCQSEVRNGGLHQFFTNSTGVLAPEAVQAYRALEMPQIAEGVERAMRWFGFPYPREKRVRVRLLDSWNTTQPGLQNPFGEKDDEFFRLIDWENGGFLAAADVFAAKSD